jgi:glycine/D-amino acid oxidase-like deaminating enzyme
VHTTDGAEHRADWVVVSAGSWTPLLLPFLQDLMWPTAQPVMHFHPQDSASYQPELFPVWTADVDETGWYGFPAKEDGTLKVANHGPGWAMDPRGPRQMPEGTEERFRQFFGEALPGLADAPKLFERLCFYCDTFDGDFWIDHDPERPGLLVSTGGSGHAFKFTPLIGSITADVLEGIDNPWAERFAWRERSGAQREASRYGDAPPRK